MQAPCPAPHSAPHRAACAPVGARAAGILDMTLPRPAHHDRVCRAAPGASGRGRTRRRSWPSRGAVSMRVEHAPRGTAARLAVQDERTARHAAGTGVAESDGFSAVW
jgi:hypothetical protein